MEARHNDGKHRIAPQQHMDRSWGSALGNLISRVPAPAHGGPEPSVHILARNLHHVSRPMRHAAHTSIRHLSLSRYQRGRLAAQRLVAEAGESVTPSMAAAAAVPPIPWALLEATPSLTSLDFTADQLEQLLAGGAVVEVAPAAAPAAAPAYAAHPNVLVTTLGRLRCLKVTGMDSRQQLAYLGQMLAGTTQLTALVVKGSPAPLRQQHPREQQRYLHCGPLLTALEAASQTAAAAGGGGAGPATPAAAASGGGGPGVPPPAAAGAGASTTAPAAAAAIALTTRVGGRSTAALLSPLLPLQRLEVWGPLRGLVPAVLRQPLAAARLTALHLRDKAAVRAELGGMTACWRLRELVIDPPGGHPREELHAPLLTQPDLTRLTALTRLEVWEGYRAAVPPMVCQLPTLHHLAVGSIHGRLGSLPSSMSCLQQLRVLDLRAVRVQELPTDLGKWLPQLEELDVSYGSISSVPAGLTRLTRLDASHTRVTQASDLAHLVTLKELRLEGSVLQAPLQPLTQLSDLQTLTLEWATQPSSAAAEQLCMPAPLPALRCLDVKGLQKLWQVQAVVAGAQQQLTRLALRMDLEEGEVAELWQLGVLPRLEQLVLGWTFGEAGTNWTAAASWLQQQLSLTGLEVHGWSEGALLHQLPAQLEELSLRWFQLSQQQPSALPQLSHLRKLSLDCHMLQPLPPGLSSLTSLEVLRVGEGNVQDGWELLAQLPLLRRVESRVTEWMVPALRYAPHLCWALPAADA